MAGPRYVVLPDEGMPPGTPERAAWDAQQLVTVPPTGGLGDAAPVVSPGGAPAPPVGGQATKPVDQSLGANPLVTSAFGGPTTVAGPGTAELLKRAARAGITSAIPGMGLLATGADMAGIGKPESDVIKAGEDKSAAAGAAAAPASTTATPADRFANFAAGAGGGGGKPPPKVPLDKLDEYDRATQEALRGAYDEAELAKLTHTGVINKTQKYIKEHLAGLAAAREMDQHFQDRARNDAIEAQSYAAEMGKQAASQSIDPEHFWKNKSTAQRIQWGIALALGEFGSHMPHVSGAGPSAAFQMFQSAITRDMEAQKDNIANMWKSAAHGSELAKDKMAFARFQADQMDKRETSAWAALNAQLEGLKATSSNADANLKIAEAQAEIASRIGAVGQTMEMRRYQTMMQQFMGAAQGSAALQKGYAEYQAKVREYRFKLQEGPSGVSPEEAAARVPMMSLGHFAASGRGFAGASEAETGMYKSPAGASGVSGKRREAIEKEAEAAAGDQKYVKDLDALPNFNWNGNAKYNPWSKEQADVAIGDINIRTQLKVQDRAKRLASAGDEDGAKQLHNLINSKAIIITGNESDAELAAKKTAIKNVTGAGQTPIADAAAGGAKKPGGSLSPSAKPVE